MVFVKWGEKWGFVVGRNGGMRWMLGREGGKRREKRLGEMADLDEWEEELGIDAVKKKCIMNSSKLLNYQ